MTVAHAATAEDEVLAVLRAQWALERAGAPAEQQLAVAIPDYTEFNGTYPARIEGRDMAVRIMTAENRNGTKILATEMLSPKVQVLGDTAIVTYQFAGVLQGADGRTYPDITKTTRVYARIDGAWRLVHANFAPGK